MFSAVFPLVRVSGRSSASYVYVVVIRRASARVYDQYLRANRVEDGNASYGRALKLILAAPFKDALGTYTVSR